jgi:cbb3-type cytochrome oxidase subunit 1
MAARLLKFAVVYLMLGMGMGMVMGITHHFEYAPVHAHINLLGWASLALVAMIYHAYPKAAQTALARWHYRLHVTGLPIFMVGQFLLLSNHGRVEWLVAAGAAITFAGIALFAVNLMKTLAAEQRAGGLPSSAGSARL